MKHLLACLLLLLSVISLSAQDSIATFIINDQERSFNLSFETDFLWDSSAQLKIEDVIAAPLAKKFINKDSASTIKLNYDGATWRRIRLVNNSEKPALYFAQTMVDSMWVYEVDENQTYNYITGRNVKQQRKPFKDPSGYIPIYLNKGETKTFYFRIKEELFPRSSIRQLFLYSHQNLRYQSYFNNFYFGAMAVLICICLLLFFVFKDKTYLLLALPVIGLVLWFWMNTHLFHQLFTTGPLFGRYYSYLFTAWFMPSSFLFAMAHYLNLKERVPWAFYAVHFLIVAVIAGFAIDAFAHINFDLGNRMVLLAILFFIGTPAYLMFKGDRKAKIWFWFMIPFIATGTFFIINLVFIPVQLPITSMQLLQVGSLVSATIIGYALYDRISATVNERIKAVKEKERLVREQNVILEKKVEERTHELEVEKAKSESILLNILPEKVADELKETGGSEARLYENVTVLFTDFVDFTKAGEMMTAKELVSELHTCFKAFDEIIQNHGLEKIKTVGDAYIAVAGMPLPTPDHACQVAKAAIDIRDFMAKRKLEARDKTFCIRLGIHSGPVVAGIVGVKKFAYDIWGDTVNTAARMEQHSEPGKINISDITFQLIRNSFACSSRGQIIAKNKGMMKMYFIDSVEVNQTVEV